MNRFVSLPFSSFVQHRTLRRRARAHPFCPDTGRADHDADCHARPQLHGLRTCFDRRRGLLALPPLVRRDQHDHDRVLGERPCGLAETARQDPRGRSIACFPSVAALVADVL